MRGRYHLSRPVHKLIRMEIPIETFTLPNGVRVVVSEDHTAPLVAVNLL